MRKSIRPVPCKAAATSSDPFIWEALGQTRSIGRLNPNCSGPVLFRPEPEVGGIAATYHNSTGSRRTSRLLVAVTGTLAGRLDVHGAQRREHSAIGCIA